jgi:outer membrane protein TolC
LAPESFIFKVIWMKRIVSNLIVLVIFGSTTLNAQKVITLRECYDKAYAITPIAGEKKIYSEIWQLKDQNLSRSWLPALDANGNLVYNSSVVDMTEALGSLPVPGIADLIKPLPHEQYRVTLDINQMIFDGGTVKSARALEKIDLSLNEKQNEVDLYKLRGAINTYYFNLLLLDRQKALLRNFLEVINKRISSVNSALTSGVMLKSDLDLLTSEKIKLEQQLAENDTRKTSVLKILSGLTGIEMDTTTQLVIPVTRQAMTNDLIRPELELFDLRKEQLDATLDVIHGKRMPKAFGFATLGYGNPPGNNFFKDKFAPYYIVGIGAKWNIFDWNKARNEEQVVSLQKSMIDKRKTDLTENLDRLLDAKGAEIRSFESLLSTDAELIILRKRITATAESQYENGTITATDYLNELNSERQALLNFEIHTINLAMSRTEFLNISGKNIE